MSEAGSRPLPATRLTRARGFTLLELLVVVAIIAMATTSVSFAMRDPADIQLEREAQRLAALLESARSMSRASGVPVRWRATADGFQFEGLPRGALPQNWLDTGTIVSPNRLLELGPEPLLPRQGITLRSSHGASQTWRIATDGLRPFSVQRAQAITAVQGSP